MAFDPGLAQTLRDALSDWPITEKKMFGGLAFLLNGHMVCGVHKGGVMLRAIIPCSRFTNSGPNFVPHLMQMICLTVPLRPSFMLSSSFERDCFTAPPGWQETRP